MINYSILSPYQSPLLAIGEVDYMEAIPESYIHIVVFLCIEKDGERIPIATGFFVRVPIENSSNSTADYIVTARHCIIGASNYGKIFVRFNRVNDKFIEIPTDVNDWYTHDSADVAAIPISSAALPVGVKRTDLDATSLSFDAFCGDSPDYKMTFKSDLYGEKEIQPRVGHQVYFLGLFTQHYGDEHNLPIARFGNISRMPSEIILKYDGISSKIIAYLVEFHSLGGHSGSPVFFLYPIETQDELPIMSPDKNYIEKYIVTTGLLWVTGCIGIITGHYPISKEAKRTGEFKNISGNIQTELNSGIAIVTPTEAIRQLLLRNDIVEKRRKLGDMIESNKPKAVPNTNL